MPRNPAFWTIKSLAPQPFSNAVATFDGSRIGTHPSHPDCVSSHTFTPSRYDEVRRKSLLRLEYDGAKLEGSDEEVAQAAMEKYAYYPCSKCGKAYFGGAAACDAAVADMEFDPEELVCGACSGGACFPPSVHLCWPACVGPPVDFPGAASSKLLRCAHDRPWRVCVWGGGTAASMAQICPKHGTDYLEWKCRYCCSVAVFFCFGSHHFCKPCHDAHRRCMDCPVGDLPQCPAGPVLKQLEASDCPLNCEHPPTGEEFALGCGLCRNAQTF